MIIVGDTSEDLAIYANSQSSDFTLLSDENFSSFNKKNNYYTSVGDLNIDRLKYVLHTSEKIFYYPPPSNIWSNDETREQTEILLLTEKKKYDINIIGAIPNYLNQISKTIPHSVNRITKENQIWFYGCSITNGVGVNKKEMYPTILAEKIGLPFKNNATVGSSNQYQASLIFKSDIKKGDIIIWGITSSERSIIYGKTKYGKIKTKYGKIVDNQKDNILNITIQTYELQPKINDLFPLELLLSDHMLYENITYIQGVQNFCNKMGVKLLMGGILASKLFNAYLINFNNYKDLDVYKFLDVGTDNTHPGPETHKIYAKNFYNFYLNTTQ